MLGQPLHAFTMPRVSVIIPAFNAATFILLTLRHALLSSYKDFEIVIVNDGSTDDLLAILQGCDPRVRVISQPNRGMSAARNLGIEYSDSEYIALLDSDDIWHPEKLTAQVSLMDARPDVGLCFGEFRAWDGIAPIVFPDGVNPESIVSELSGWIYHKLVLVSWALPSTLLFRRDVISNLGPFLTEDSQTDDWEFVIRASRHYQFAKLAAVIALYRQHPAQLSKKLRKKNPEREMRETMISKYGMTGPNGQPVELAELNKRRYASELAFGASHLEVGELAVGFECIVRAARLKPLDRRAYLAAPKALAKRMLRYAELIQG